MNPKETKLPFSAFDSELHYLEINIPDGCEATIKDGKIIIRRKENKNEKIKNAIEAILNDTEPNCYNELGVSKSDVLAWFKRQGEQKLSATQIQLWHGANEKCTDDDTRVLFHSTYDNSWNLSLSRAANWNVIDKWALLQDIINIEQKPAWSEEDEIRLNTICGLLEDLPSQQNWLRELKNRVQPQQKVNGNERDEEKLESIINKARYNCLLKNDDISFLKSIKGRVGCAINFTTKWKPSEEQMSALEQVQDGVYRLGYLKSLYEDLKKL